MEEKRDKKGKHLSKDLDASYVCCDTSTKKQKKLLISANANFNIVSDVFI